MALFANPQGKSNGQEDLQDQHYLHIDLSHQNRHKCNIKHSECRFSDFTIQVLNTALTYRRRVDPALLPPDDSAAAKQREPSPPAECHQWQPAADCRAMDP